LFQLFFSLLAANPDSQKAAVVEKDLEEEAEGTVSLNRNLHKIQ
jgi:hypothetical protein